MMRVASALPVRVVSVCTITGSQLKLLREPVHDACLLLISGRTHQAHVH
jgi:hypothetical protein